MEKPIEIQYLKNIATLQVMDNDVIVVKIDGSVKTEIYVRIKEEMKEIFPNNKIIVLTNGADIGIMREAK